MPGTPVRRIYPGSLTKREEGRKGVDEGLLREFSILLLESSEKAEEVLRVRNWNGGAERKGMGMGRERGR